jgi:hypothetical protein
MTDFVGLMMPFWTDSGNTDRVMGTHGRRGRRQQCAPRGDVELLIIKTEGPLQDWARRQGRICLIGVVIGIAVVSLWTPLMEQRIAERWFSLPHILFLWPVPIATAAVVVWEWRALSGTVDAAPFIAAILLFPAGLSRRCDQPVADDRTLPFYAVAGGGVAEHPGLPWAASTVASTPGGRRFPGAFR